MQVFVAPRSHRSGALGQRAWPICSLATACPPTSWEASFAATASFSGSPCLTLSWAY